MKKLVQFKYAASHLAFQGALVAVQLYNAYGDFVPSKYKGLIAAGVGLAQAYVLFVNHGKPAVPPAVPPAPPVS